MNKLFIVLSLVLFSTATFAEQSYGRIVELKGQGFIYHDGKTKEMKKGDTIYFNSEIVVENSGQVTFTDNADHRYHLGNAATVAIFADRVELRSGDIWIQSLNKVDDYKITTANATVNYQGGEAILSYDTIKGKTQLMVINSNMKLANLRTPELNLTVAEGNFSFVDNGYEEGAPRDPTPVGEKTYGQLVSLFHGVSPMDKNSVQVFKEHKEEVSGGAHAPTRAIASKEEASPVAHEDVIKNKEYEDYKRSLLEGMTNKAAKSVVKKAEIDKKSSAPVSTKLVVTIYGQKAKTASERSVRAPASVVDEAVTPVENYNQTNNPAQYKESDKLIEQLNKL